MKSEQKCLYSRLSKTDPRTPSDREPFEITFLLKSQRTSEGKGDFHTASFWNYTLNRYCNIDICKWSYLGDKNNALPIKVPAFWLRYKLLFKRQRHCTHIPLWCWTQFTKVQLTGVHTTPPRHPTPLKHARSNRRSLSSRKQGAAKTSCQTGKEDKMLTSIPSGNLLFSPGCST